VVRSLTAQYRELLSVRAFSELKKKVGKARKEVLPSLLQWSRDTEFFRSSDASKLTASKVRDELAMLFLISFSQDVPYVIAAHNNTFQRGRWSFPQLQPEPFQTEIQSQRFFDGFKLGAAYLWHSLIS